MILIAILSTSLMAFAIGEEQNANSAKSILQGGAVSYSHVVHEYGPSYKYAVKTSPSSVTSATYPRYVTTPATPIQSTAAYASQKPLSYTHAEPFTKSHSGEGNAAYIQLPTIQAQVQNRLKSVTLSSNPQLVNQFGPPVTTSPKYDANSNFQTFYKQVPFPVFQPYSLTTDKLPYSVVLPVPVRTPYAVAVPKVYPVTHTKLVPYPVNIPVTHTIPVVVPYPLYLTTKAIIGNGVQSGGYSAPHVGHVNIGHNILGNGDVSTYKASK